MWVDFRVDVGRFFVAEGRACWGQVKKVAFSKIAFSKVENTIKENRVWKMCTVWAHLLNRHQILAQGKRHVDKYVHIGQIR